jgi:hypothetical protein
LQDLQRSWKGWALFIGWCWPIGSTSDVLGIGHGVWNDRVLQCWRGVRVCFFFDHMWSRKLQCNGGVVHGGVTV